MKALEREFQCARFLGNGVATTVDLGVTYLSIVHDKKIRQGRQF